MSASDNPTVSKTDETEIITKLHSMAISGGKPSDMLRYLVLDLKIEQQLELMKLFTKAFDVSLGEVTAISGWWHDETAELNDNDINHYIGGVVGDTINISK
ncbi:MAG: hypothetical protein L3J51_00085 [Cocleimonas sp.]|nr:hypothetical protein [Cocleimonas sp.]